MIVFKSKLGCGIAAQQLVVAFHDEDVFGVGLVNF